MAPRRLPQRRAWNAGRPDVSHALMSFLFYVVGLLLLVLMVLDGARRGYL